jgi:hypothetical protein
MSYPMSYSGELKFSHDLSIGQLVELQRIIGEDVRDLPNVVMVGDFGFFDLELLDDYSGIKHDGSESSYHIPDQINTILRHLRDNFVDAPRLTGVIHGTGREPEDAHRIIVEEVGGARDEKVKMVATTNGNCPHCGVTL